MKRKSYLFLTKVGLVFFLTIVLASVLEAQVIQFGNGYVNVSKRKTGGKVEPGDTLEIRMSVHVPWGFNGGGSGRIFRVRYLDSLPSNTQMLTATADRFQVLTNEGVVYKSYSLTNDSDPATYNASPPSNQYHVKINLGRFPSSPSNNSINNSNGAGDINLSNTWPNYGDAPKWWTGHLFSTAYRVRVTGGIGDSIQLRRSKFIYRLTSNGADIEVTATPYKILITRKDTMCQNGVDVSLVDSIGSTFLTGTSLNRVAGPSFLIPGYTYRNNISGSLSIDDGTYGIVNNLSPRASTRHTQSRWVDFCTASPAVPVTDSCNNRMFDGFWYIAGDHTGTSNAAGNLPVANGTRGGYMMVVNADYVTTEAFRDTVTNLCPDTYYEFSAWLKNVCPRCGADSLLAVSSPRKPGVYPNLTFAMNGKDLYSSGELDTLGWQKKGFLFRTRSNETGAIFSIRNNAQGGGGNDWAIDDIKVSACIPSLAMNYNPYVLGCREQSAIEINLICQVRYSYNGSYIHYKWQRSTNNGSSWTDISGGGGTGAATLVGGLWQYSTNYNFWASGADSGHRFRVVVATSAANLAGSNSPCAFNDGTYTYLRFITCNGIVAVKLLSFNGSMAGNKASVNWHTDKETNCSNYTVEKSTDGIHFTGIGSLPARNNNMPESYRFTDPEVLYSPAWYRLKTTDKAGMFEYSRALLLSPETIPFSLMSTQNPFSEKILLRYTVPVNGVVSALLYDAVGKLVKQQAFTAAKGFNSQEFAGMTNLAPGVYTLRLLYNNQMAVLRLIKQHN